MHFQERCSANCVGILLIGRRQPADPPFAFVAASKGHHLAASGEPDTIDQAAQPVY